MHKLCGIAILVFLSATLSAQTPPWQWVNIGGGGGNSTLFKEEPTDMVVDGEGNTYVAGAVTYFAHFDSTYIPGFGGSDVFLAKYNCEGELQWVQTAGSNNSNEDLAFVALDNSGNVYWVAELECPGAVNYPFHLGDTTFCAPQGYFIAKVDPSDGGILWFRHTDFSCVLLGMALNNGGIYINASTYSAGGNLDTGVFVKGQFLVQYDLSGSYMDVNNYGPSTVRASIRKIAVDSDGNIFGVSEISQPVVIGNDTLSSPSSPLPNGLLIKFDPDLNLLWYKIFESPSTVAFRDLSIDNLGNLAITGIFSDSLDYGNGMLLRQVSGGNSIPYLLKLNTDGDGIWARTINHYGGSSCHAYDVVHDSDDNFYVSGYYYNSIAFGPDTLRAYNSMEPFYVSYDSAGNYRYAGSMACLSNARNVGYNIAVDGNQNVFMAGTFSSGIVFQSDTIDRAYGDADIFVTKFGQPSCVPPCPVPVAGYTLSTNGLSVSFTDGSTDADSIWYTAGGNAVSGGSYLFAAPGTYTVCQYTTNNCGSDTLCQQVTVTCAPPTAGFGVDANGLIITLTDSSSLADSVHYTVGANAITGADHTFASEGTYTVCQFVGSICGTDSTCKQITVTDVGIEDIGFEYRLYPNPTNGQVTVELPAGSYTFSLYSVLGSKLSEQALVGKSIIEVGGLPSGLYLYSITSPSGKIEMGKLVIEP